jgi:23S rRNA (uridine2552-2'-O)-methyltransferase
MASYKRADHFTKAAKSRGYPARSVFKLEEIDRRVKLLRAGQRVIDLGAAPGSWSLYASTRIGKGGRIFAVDLLPLAQALPENCTFIQGDALALSNDELAKHAPYDVVLSDMAPNTSGTPGADQARSYRLLDFAIDVAERLGGTGSAFVGKIFMSPDFEVARARLRTLYGEVRTLRPEGVRASSFEVFFVASGKKALARGHGGSIAATTDAQSGARAQSSPTKTPSAAARSRRAPEEARRAATQRAIAT